MCGEGLEGRRERFGKIVICGEDNFRGKFKVTFTFTFKLGGVRELCVGAVRVSGFRIWLRRSFEMDDCCRRHSDGACGVRTVTMCRS
jgi:hypothetical protein